MNEPLFKAVARLRGHLHENHAAIRDLELLVDRISQQRGQLVAVLSILADHPDEEMRSAVAEALR